MNFDEIADELYSLPREQFTATRDERVRQTRAEGDTKLATGIANLKKPTTAAWLANLLARHHSDEVRDLVDMGAELRRAHNALEGPALKDLSTRRRELIEALVRQAESLGNERGTAPSTSVLRELENTINRAITDPDAARALAEGRLSSAYTPDSQREQWFADTSGSAASPQERQGRTKAAKRRGQKRQPQQRSKQEAEHTLSRARQRLDQARTEARVAADNVRERREELRRAERERVQADEEAETAAQEHRVAEEQVRAARVSGQ